MIIIGTKMFWWGNQLMQQPMRCGQCGTVAPFILKQGMQFITIFFVIPVIPISGMKKTAQCPNCGTRYQIAAGQN